VKTLNKLLSKAIGIPAIIASLLLAAQPAFAQLTNISLQPPNQFNSLNRVTVPSFIRFAIQGILVIAGLAFFFMLVWGGVEWILAGGDKAGAENARKRITSALIGLAIVFSAWAIIALIKVIFGVDLLSLDIPSVVNP